MSGLLMADGHLPGNDAPRLVFLGDCPAHRNDSQREGFGSGIEFPWVHAPGQRNPSAIGHRPSAIQT